MFQKIRNFKIAGITYSVVFVDNLNDGTEYGKFNEAKQIIYIANKIKIDDEWTKVTYEIQRNTFCHELYHVYQFYLGKEYDEQEACSFANFASQFIDSILE